MYIIYLYDIELICLAFYFNSKWIIIVVDSEGVAREIKTDAQIRNPDNDNDDKELNDDNDNDDGWWICWRPRSPCVLLLGLARQIEASMMGGWV